MKSKKFRVDNGAGWELDVRRYFDPATLDPEKRPVVTVPGYCMNCHILCFHPTGTSLIEYLVEGGFEVWAANLRGQGESVRRRGQRRYGFRDLALVDTPAVVDFVTDRTGTDGDAVDLIGCSLGATTSYVYLAHRPDDHGVGALVNIGGPLRWNRAHPLLRWAARWAPLLGLVRIRGTRRLAQAMTSVARRFPWLLSLYMNPDIIDLSQAEQIVKTIDDPDPQLTYEIGRWLMNRDLVVDGLNISHSLYSVDIPIQCVIALQDGIVTPEAALSVLDHIGSHDVDIVEVGTPEIPHAHADLFISDGVEGRVFRPVRKWLTRQNAGPKPEPEPHLELDEDGVRN